MAMFILLSAAEADQVRGRSSIQPTCELQPVALTDGRYILGVEVINDEAHAAHWPLLASLPQSEWSKIETLIPVGEE